MLTILKALCSKPDHKEQARAELELSRRELLEAQAQVESWTGKKNALISRIRRLESYIQSPDNSQG